MIDVKKREELTFNKQYSRFKVQIFFYNRPPITHYGNERANCTFAQMKFGHVRNVTLNREQGFKDCIERIEICERLYGRYKTAIIYDNLKKTVLADGTVQKGREIRKYVCGRLLESEDPFSSDSEKKILTEVKHFVRDEMNQFVLRPCEPKIDFKTVVAKALEKPG